jgi:alkaline phosphatase D
MDNKTGLLLFVKPLKAKCRMLKNTLFLLLFMAFYHANAQYPPNIYPDTVFAPFYYGVASGDPLKDKVIIWTKVFVADKTQPAVALKWTMATDSSFADVVQQGTALATPQHDFTAKTDVGYLDAGQKYYYRFETPDGKKSQTGIARTLPPDSVKQFKLAVVSCSSIWSGFFNAYRRIAERPDIDFVIHLGDYVYDYADDHQLNRMPAAPVVDCAGLKDWNERHTYYLLDPDLRAARQTKAWIAEWDNHDTSVEPPGKTEEAIQAFYDYLPIRMPDAAHPENIYRRFTFGKLADLNMIDMLLFRGKEEYAPGKKSVLGLAQDAWLKHNLVTSPTRWHLIGNQEMMTDWLSEGAPKFLKHGNGHVFDESNWNGYPDDRNRLYAFLDSVKLKNVVVLTGDIHMSFVMDMTATPKDKIKYNRHTGQGAVGVEVTGPSISRINMKEAGVPGAFIPAIQSFSRSLNPHHKWVQFSKHGYFTLNVTEEKCTAEFWYSNIKKQTTKETFGRGFTVTNGISHWDKKQNRNKKKAGYLAKP